MPVYLLRFVTVFSVATWLGFFLHRFFIDSYTSIQLHPLWLYYLMNYGLGLVTVISLVILSKSQSHITGFAFMGGSLIKFALFFGFFFPEIQDHPDLKKVEFVSFFIPYAITMSIEVWFLVRYLNSQE